MKEMMTGNEAIARGAYEAGIVFASAYPGTPSTEVLENIGPYKEMYAEWTPNEKVALEAAIGASFAGVRSLAAMKQVGINVAADALFNFVYTGVNGGMVLVCADDPPTVDQLDEIARISGMPDIERQSVTHVLNMRAVAIKVAKMLGKPYEELSLIVAHIGGGTSISVYKAGRMVDIVSDDEGLFSPERAGRVPCRQLIELCYSGKYDKGTIKKKLRGNGGLVAYLGTNSALEVEGRIKNGDKEAELVCHAMAYQIAKGIGELATVVNGKVDRIILTGGIAYSEMMTDLNS